MAEIPISKINRNEEQDEGGKNEEKKGRKREEEEEEEEDAAKGGLLLHDALGAKLVTDVAVSGLGGQHLVTARYVLSKFGQ